MLEETFAISRSKTGLPVICESGGSVTSSGSAQIICGENGEKLRPLFIPKGYCNDTHALFVARVGIFIIKSSWSRGGEGTDVWKVKKILSEKVLAELAYSESNGDGNIPEFLREAAEAAKKKAHNFHCREAYFVEK